MARGAPGVADDRSAPTGSHNQRPVAERTPEDIISACVKDYENSSILSADFNACKSDLQRFLFAKRYIKDSFPGWSLHARPIRFQGKNLEETRNLVSQGIAHVAGKRYIKALETLNKAVLVAPWRSRQTPKEDVEFCVAAVFGHRAAALFHMNRFAECILDICEALSLECPREIRPKLLLLKAEAFLAVQRPWEAVSVLVDEAAILRIFQEPVPPGEDPEEERKQYDTLVTRSRKEEAKISKKRKLVLEPVTPKHPTSLEMRGEVKRLQLKHGRSNVFPCASAGVKLKYDEEFGRHFVATKNFGIGDVVMVEPAFVSYLKTTTSVLTTHCYACCLYTETPFPCRMCSSVVFCSPTCASGPKGRLHAQECTFWMALMINAVGGSQEEPGPSNTSMSMVMAMRALLMKSPDEWKAFFSSVKDYATSENDKPSKIPHAVYRTDDFESVFWLVKNTKQHYQDYVFEAACASVLGMEVLDQVYFVGGNSIDTELRKNLGGLLTHLAIAFATNWDSVREQNMKGIDESLLGNAAAVIHPTASLFNYSCSPNLFSWHYGDTLVMKACRPVKKGEVLYINRIGRFDERDAEIRQAYAGVMGFKCKCEPCLKQWPTMPYVFQVFNRGLWFVKCMYCTTVFHVMGSVGPGQRCTRCGRGINEWLAAYKSVHRELFPKGRTSGSWSGPKDVKPLLPFIDKVFNLCGDGSYPVIYADSLVRKWMLQECRAITHPGLKPVKPSRR